MKYKIAYDNFGASSLSAQHNYIYSKVRVWLKEPYPGEEWTVTPTYVNAFYSVDSNELMIPQAILSAPFFDISLPDYMNYGAVGSIMGHEMIHAFDSTGASYGPSGKKENWWTESTFKTFQDKSKCFVDEYSSFKVRITRSDISVDG